MPKQRRKPIFEYGGYWLSRNLRSAQWKRTWYDAALRRTCSASLGDGDFGDLDVAKDALIAFVQTNRTLNNDAPETVPLALVIKKYLDEHVPTIRSAAARRTELAFWLREFADKSVAQITPQAIEAFIVMLRAAGHADGYISRVLDAGRSALNRAKRLKQVRDVPFIRDVETAADRRNKRPLGDPMTMDQAIELLDAAAAVPHMLTFNMIMACTLARPEAALELGHGQIDRAANVIDLNPKGRKQTRKHRPVVPIARALLPFLEPAPAKPWPKRRRRPSVTTDRLVIYGGRPVKSVKTSWARLRRAASLPQGITPYSWRHTMGRVLRAARVPQDQIDIMLGHLPRGSAATTSIYAPYDPDYCREAVEAIDDWFRESRRVRKRSVAPRKRRANAR
jgi:site-specific recombinase XerD